MMRAIDRWARLRHNLLVVCSSCLMFLELLDAGAIAQCLRDDLQIANRLELKIAQS